MVTINKAYEIAKEKCGYKFGSRLLKVYEFPEKWVFAFGSYCEINGKKVLNPGGPCAQVDRETGEPSPYSIPPLENLYALKKAKEIEISEFLKENEKV